MGTIYNNYMNLSFFKYIKAMAVFMIKKTLRKVPNVITTKLLFEFVGFLTTLIIIGLSFGSLYFYFKATYNLIAKSSFLTAFFLGLILLLCNILMWLCLLRAILANSYVKDRLMISSLSSTTSSKWCTKCCRVKPYRAHHCSVCKKCVLEMDHHCPWVYNCVGLHNRKFFILFLIYSNFGLLIYSFPNVILFYFDNKFSVVMYSHIFICSLLPVVLIPFTLFHLFLVMINSSTIDVHRDLKPYGIRAKIKNSFLRSNFERLFGHNKFLWFLPVSTTLFELSFKKSDSNVPLLA